MCILERKQISLNPWGYFMNIVKTGLPKIRYPGRENEKEREWKRKRDSQIDSERKLIIDKQ